VAVVVEEAEEGCKNLKFPAKKKSPAIDNYHIGFEWFHEIFFGEKKIINLI